VPVLPPQQSLALTWYADTFLLPPTSFAVNHGIWNMLLAYIARDMKSLAPQYFLVFDDIRRLLNLLRFEGGTMEAKTLAHALAALYQEFPSVFAAHP
jgi:hypothetical protein